MATNREALVQFANWFQRYSVASGGQRTALSAEGIALAKKRRAVMKDLIQTDPEEALRQTVSHQLRVSVPQTVAEHLEERVSGRGELAVLAAIPEPGREQEVTPVFRTAEIAGRHYDAFVYGRRLGEPTRRNIPLHGIAIDGQFAVSASRVRVLDTDEAADALKALRNADEVRCGVSGEVATSRNEPTPVEVAGKTYYLCSTNHIQPFNDRWVAAEGNGPTGGEVGADIGESAWTEGTKRLLVIRVDFPDLSLSLTDTAAATLVSGLDAFYTEMSYGRTGFSPVGGGSDVTPILRMTNSAAWYGTNNYYNQLRSEARAAAAAAGYSLPNYELDLICIGAVPGFGWSGLGYIGASGAWLRNSFGVGVAAHELGHNYGLNHASFWDTSGESVIGPGTSVEYGDSFDTMGSASAGANHFNARYKAYLNWIRANEVQKITNSGTYQIYTHDAAAASGVRGLYVARDSQTNYWIEFRQKFTGNKWLMNGVGLRTAQSGNQRSQLLDVTPGSADGKNDSTLLIGRTYSDIAAAVHITPIGKRGTTPESLDVVVNIGSFPGNVAPTVTITAASTSAGTGVTLNFAAAATDANGDALAYFWDFGDGNFSTNGTAASKSWSTAGEYVVRCVVTDMKGGTASDSVVVRIGSSTTYRISGRVTDGATPLSGVRVSVSTSRMTYTDSDGTYNLVNLPAGSYTVSASLYPYSLAAAGFNNPVIVGPDRANIDFATSGTLPPSIVAQPASQSANPGSSVTLTVSATGPGPLTYQWRFNGANLTGATNALLALLNFGAARSGNYVVVVANAGGAVTSQIAVITLNTPPTVAIASPTDGAVLTAPASFTLAANASDIGGSVSLVQFYDSGTLLGIDTTSPYSVSVIGLTFGSHTLAAVATDNLGLKATNSVAIFVNGTPTVALTSPANGAAFVAPANLSLNATASDLDGTVTKVEFFQGTTKLGEDSAPPYSLSWTGVTTGTYALTARATDSQGVVSTSAVVNISVGSNLPPTVVITSPTNGARFKAPASFVLNATASDSDGSVARIDFYNSGALIGSDWTQPYSVSVSSLAAGTYTLRAVVFDNLGARTTNSVGITVSRTARNGTYAGLYYETNAIVPESSGSLNLTLTEQGTFSGSIFSLGRRMPFRGRLDTNNEAVLRIPRAPAPALYLAFGVTESNGLDQVTGTVTDGNWHAELWGAHAPYHAITNPAPAAGAYTFLLPGTVQTSGPQGYGYGTVQVTPGGRVVFQGALNDSHRAVRTTTLAANGLWPLHTSAYRGAGLAMGWIHFENHTGSDFSGEVAHIRPSGPIHPLYRDGFTNEATLVGSRFVCPNEAGAPVLSLPDATLTYEGGNWHSRTTNRVSLISGNKLRDNADMRIKGLVNPKNGLISGTTTDDAGRPAPWRGAVFQKAGFGAGQARGTNGTTRVLLMP